ncbi:hypothetical protein BD769DRAFT_1669709 [Suillus cothurnatus]|nr:hypothetical protein BD769DRAFT_1669709 [Suillus cothurnatus]
MPQCMFCGKATTTQEGLKRHITGRPECQRQRALMINDIEAENLNTPDADLPPVDSHVHPHLEPNPAPRKSCRITTVEEVEDEDGIPFSYTRCYFKPQADTSWALHEGETKFERYRRYQEEEVEDRWLPFEDARVVKCAASLRGSKDMTHQGRLSITQNCTKLSFHNNCSFLQRVDALPCGPGWSCRKVTVCGNHKDELGVPLEEEVELWSHDPVECVQELIGNPFFKADMAYSPAKAYADCAGQHRVIDEMWTADWWGKTQKVLPKGATIASIILSSDKTCLSQFQGDNIDSPMWDPESTKNILEMCKNGQHPPEFEENGPCAIYKPFWADLPHSNIFLAFTPDLLHQLHKGVFKDHLVKWCIDIVGEEEMDARFKVVPDYPGLRHFKKGILTIKQWTGREHKEMQQVFIGLLTGVVPSCVLVVAHSILNFSYHAQLKIHMTDMLDALQTALGVFHANKDILKELSICKHFNIPKLHQLTHYVQSIMLLGMADGFNFELPKCLHIDFAKQAYCATNK